MKGTITDNGRGFCGTHIHPYEMYLELNEIHLRRTFARRPRSIGFVERLNRAGPDEFFHYNTERTHQANHNLSRKPADTLNEFVKNNVRQGP